VTTRTSRLKRIAPRHVAAALVVGALLMGSAGMSHAAPPTTCAAQLPQPDPVCTPGLLNPAVTQNTISRTICVSGWTKTVRPPVSYTNPLKLQLMKAYGESGSPSNYELDHFVPLELGGHPSDPKNLWPEPHAPAPNSPQKDKLENYLKAQVCAGTMTLADAQRAISTDWEAAWKAAGLP
jgi:hypothetical protein